MKELRSIIAKDKQMTKSQIVHDATLDALGKLVYGVFSDQPMTLDRTIETRAFIGDNDDDDDDDDDCYVIEGESEMSDYVLNTASFIDEHGETRPLILLTGKQVLKQRRITITGLPSLLYGGTISHPLYSHAAIIYIEDGCLHAEYKEPQE